MSYSCNRNVFHDDGCDEKINQNISIKFLKMSTFAQQMQIADAENSLQQIFVIGTQRLLTGQDYNFLFI